MADVKNISAHPTFTEILNLFFIYLRFGFVALFPQMVPLTLAFQ